MTGLGLIIECREVLLTRSLIYVVEYYDSIAVVQLNNDDYVSEAEIENLQERVKHYLMRCNVQ